jgi:hypothetical protein
LPTGEFVEKYSKRGGRNPHIRTLWEIMANETICLKSFNRYLMALQNCLAEKENELSVLLNLP